MNSRAAHHQRPASAVVEATEDAASLARRKLIESCQGLVRTLAWKIHRKLPRNVEIDDLIAYGEVGLAQAAGEFDETRGNRFTTYAYYRIRGAIFDGLSKMSWFSRQAYHSSKYEQMANELLRLNGDEPPEPGAAAVDDEIRWFSHVSSSLAVVYLASGAGGWPLEEIEAAPADDSIGAELREKLRVLIDDLPHEAGVLIRSTYYDGLTLQEAGKRLGISKAWASRLHARTLSTLARSLRKAGVAD